MHLDKLFVWSLHAFFLVRWMQFEYGQQIKAYTLVLSWWTCLYPNLAQNHNKAESIIFRLSWADKALEN